MISRRQFLKDAGLLVFGASLGAVALDAGCKGAAKNTTPTTYPTVPNLNYLMTVDPVTADNQDLPQTPISGLHVYGEATPTFNTQGFTLKIYGLVDNPLTLTLADFQKYERTTQVTLLICPDSLVDNPQFGGVLLATLLRAAGVQPAAKGVTFHSVSGTFRHTPIANAVSGDILVADQVDGVALPPAHGYPLRLVQPHVKGAEWLKWLTGIEVTDQG